MASRTGLTIRPQNSPLSNLRSLYRRPPTTIAGIDQDTWYSPDQPVTPFGNQGTEPRQFQTWSGQNLIYTPRSDAEFTAADLKSLATYPLARICIENVKDTVTRAPWEVQMRPHPNETRKEVAERSKGDGNLVKLNRFFEYPDREHNWSEWLRPLLDDMLVIDAASILIRQTFNGDIVELPVIRGEMITRYVDENGGTPLPPSPAYAQNWWGLPLVNLTTDQLVYKPRSIVPRNTLSSQMYGMSPTEQLAQELLIGIKRLQFTLSYYTEGSVPGVIHVVPRGTSPDRIEEAMQWMNSELAGNLAARNQWRMIQGFNEPGKEEQILFAKEPLLAGLYDEKHIREVAFGYGTSPQRLMKMIRTEGTGASDSAEVEGTLPWVLWVKGVIDYIIQKKMGLADYEIAINPYAEPDPLKNAAALTMLVSKAILTPNEARKRVGEELRPEAEADRLGVIGATGFVPIGIPSVQAGVQIDDDGNPEPHDVTPTPPPLDPNKNRPTPGGKGKNPNRSGTPASQQAGGGRSTGKEVQDGKNSLSSSKKKLLKAVGARIEGHALTPESEAAVHHVHSAVHNVFKKQHARGKKVVTSHFRKALGMILTKRKFGSVQFDLSIPDQNRVFEIPVDMADLAEKGRDLNPHVTVRWGLHPEVTAQQVDAITRGCGDIEITLGPLETFPEGPDGVPLIIRFESEKLAKLHDALGVLPHTDTHPDYKPHICVAYLKPNVDPAIYTSAVHLMQGETIRLEHLVLSGVDYTMQELEKLLRRKGKKAKLRKITREEAEEFADALIAALEAEWSALPGEIRSPLENATLSGVGKGMLEADVSNASLLARANTIAQDYASDRAAELVGRKYDEEGNLIANPNAKWAISDTTRDEIHDIVTEAFADETSLTDVADRIQSALEDEAEGSGIFSDSRAMMIARTEIANAQARGNFSVWQESGAVKTITWLTSEDENVCPECDGNDQVSVAIGKPFPSGDLYPGAHPLCRCVIVVDELS